MHTDVAGQSLGLLHKAVEFLKLGHALLARPALFHFKHLVRLLPEHVLDLGVGGQIEDAVRHEVIRRVNRSSGENELDACLGLVVGPLLLGKRLDKPLGEIVRAPLVAGHLHVTQSLLDHGLEHVCRDGDVLADLPELGDEILRDGPRPFREELQLDNGDEDVDGVVDARVHPLFLAIDAGADKGAPADAGDCPEGKGLELHGRPV